MESVTAVARFNLQVNGPVILPNTNFLTIAPPNSTMTSPPGATTTALLTLSNTGPDDIFANMLSGSVNPNVTAEFGTGDTATTTATATSITFALATGAATNALHRPGPQQRWLQPGRVQRRGRDGDRERRQHHHRGQH